MAVATAKKQREQTEPYLFAAGVGAAVVVGLLLVMKFVREAKEAAAVRHRKRQPWEV